MNLFPIGKAENEIILNEIRPFVKKLLNDKCIEDFHFLMEPEIRFRLFGETAKFRPQAEEWLKRLKKTGQIEPKSSFNDAYEGEEGAAGKNGQDAYYAYMKAGSEIAFTMRGKTFENPINFYHLRGFHFILNSYGFNIVDEINFYINDVLPERLGTFKQQDSKAFQNNKATLLSMVASLYSKLITM